MTPKLEADLVQRMINSFPRGAGAGPSALRPQHLLDAIRSSHGDEALEHLAEMCNLLAQGRAPTAAAPHIASAGLMALRKNDGGLHPIAVGESIRRLVAKCLCSITKEQARHYLWPLQLGVSTPLGAEVGAQTARQWCERHAGDPDRALVTIDFENAFNTVDRTAILRQVRHRFPGLSAWVEWCYGAPTNLLFDGLPIPSSAGVQQGDPLGPLLFALPLQPVLQRVASEFQSENTHGEPLDLIFSFLDDGVLAGPHQVVARALHRLTEEAAAIGLRLNPSKCELVLLSAPGSSSVDRSLFPNEIAVRPDGNFKLLGVGIGSHSYCASLTAKRVAKMAPLLAALGDLANPQIALPLLRQCASYGKVVYSLRSTPPEAHLDELLSFDKDIRRCFEGFSNTYPDDDAWLQASLSVRWGGLGLRSAHRHSPAAFLASRSSCHALCSEVDPSHFWEVSQPMSAAALAVQSFNSTVKQEHRVPVDVPDTLRQKALSEALDDALWAELHDGAAGNLRRQAHLALLKQEGSGSWLHAVPSPAFDNAMTSAQSKVCLQRRLGLKVRPTPVFCPYCDGICDEYGDHDITCCSGGDRTKRHNRIRNRGNQKASAAALNPELEKPGLLCPRPLVGGSGEDGSSVDGPNLVNGRRPADVFLPCWYLGGPAALDFAVTSGLRADVLRHSASDGSYAVKRYEAHKRSHLNTADLCREEGLSFVPMVVEAHGGSWGPEARQTWSRLAKLAAEISGEDQSVEAARLQQALSITLQRENARAILRRLAAPQLSPGSAAASIELAASASAASSHS